MTDHNPNRPSGSSVPPERDRVGGTPPPEHRGPRGDGGNSAMALIVGALAVALIIGAFFWFAGDTEETATLDDPAVVEEELGTEEPAEDEALVEEPLEEEPLEEEALVEEPVEEEPLEEEALDNETDVIIEEDTDVTQVEPDAAEPDEVEPDAVEAEPTEEEEVIDETQQ